MFELRSCRTRVGVAVVVVGLAAGAAAAPASSAPPCGVSTATDAARDAALARIGIFAGVEESEQPSTAQR